MYLYVCNNENVKGPRVYVDLLGNNYRRESVSYFDLMYTAIDRGVTHFQNASHTSNSY